VARAASAPLVDGTRSRGAASTGAGVDWSRDGGLVDGRSTGAVGGRVLVPRKSDVSIDASDIGARSTRTSQRNVGARSSDASRRFRVSGKCTRNALEEEIDARTDPLAGCRASGSAVAAMGLSP